MEVEVSIPAEVERLVERFHLRRSEYESPNYVEARVRVDFINPLFMALGWDVENQLNLGEHEREVVTEGRLRLAGSLKAPDYIFRINGQPLFMGEAKKPAVNLRDDPRPALQLRRYGWNAGDIGVGVLTDFQEFAVYDCRIPPDANDKASTSLVDYYTVAEYAEQWSEIESRFSREAALSGALEEYARSLPGIRGKRRVDRVFLAELEEWRKSLAVDLASRNRLSEDALNHAVQLTIDRVVFLRICEDRGLEPYGGLREDAQRTSIYPRLLERFVRADEKYNSGLFHFRKERARPAPDVLTPTLTVGDAVLARFIRRLYWPDGPYEFSVLPPDVLGQVYERFLGKVIRLEKPDARL
jgi:hypothetical protein